MTALQAQSAATPADRIEFEVLLSDISAELIAARPENLCGPFTLLWTPCGDSSGWTVADCSLSATAWRQSSSTTLAMPITSPTCLMK